MSSFRIIPKIEVKQFNLVKGYKLEGLRVLGSPLKYIKEYEEINTFKGEDYQDVELDVRKNYRSRWSKK